MNALRERSLRITLPDGSARAYPEPVDGAGFARSIGPGLARDAVLLKIDGEFKDLSHQIEQDCHAAILTREDEEALPVLRHSCAHILAEAVQSLFPDTQIAFGPPTENGFYYDFASPHRFTPEDFERIETKMRQIIAEDRPFVREVWSRKQAETWFLDKGEHLKAEHIPAIPKEEELSIYKQGEWLDLCRGPHLPSTGAVGDGFKLLRVSGAYWKGDTARPMLQRISGTCFPSQKALSLWLERLKEAEKRDHRKLGQAMDLFHLQEEAAGSVFWHEKGWVLFQACEAYLRRRLSNTGYTEVKTPQLLNRSLWEKSGHWDKFREHMFVLEDETDHFLALKPMNCPGHVQIFNRTPKSYRDLPVRIAEFGHVHRNEPSGALLGLVRVRAFTQDDGHIFCEARQVMDESLQFCTLLQQVYRDFGFAEVSIKFSDRPAVRAGSDTVWDRAETALKEAIDRTGLDYTLNPGEGAFYGPKLEFVLRDTIGREWQCGTLQVDFVLPERLGAVYVDKEGAKQTPVLLHRALFGSMERFIGILIEQYAGRLPLWLAPVQVAVATITNDSDSYATAVAERMKTAGLRVETETRNETINYKIRLLTEKKTPVIAIIGKREEAEGTVVLRRFGVKTQETLAVDEAIAMLAEQALPPDLSGQAEKPS